MKTIKPILMRGFLLVALFVASCDNEDPAVPVDKTALNASITEANTLLTTTIEGVGTGNYHRGSQARLNEAVTVAQVIADLPEATQTTVTGATASLDNEIDVYQAAIVVPIDPANLVGQWTFDQLASAAVGTVVKDYSGNNHDGTIKAGHATFGAGTPVLATDRYGVAGKAILLDKGANIEIPYNTALNPPALSISSWVKLSEVRNNRFVGLHSWIGYKFEVQDGNRPFATVAHSGGSYDRDAGVAIGQDAWYHLVMTFTAGTMKFYINGVLVKTWTDVPNAAKSIADHPYNLVLGCDFPTDKYSSDANGTNFDNVNSPEYHLIPAAWGGYLHGYLDEVRIYKSVLSDAQVTSIYDLEKP